jgi:hypothetical protein
MKIDGMHFCTDVVPYLASLRPQLPFDDEPTQSFFVAVEAKTRFGRKNRARPHRWGRLWGQHTRDLSEFIFNTTYLQ